MKLTVTFNENEVKSMIDREKITHEKGLGGYLPLWFLTIVNTVRPDLLRGKGLGILKRLRGAEGKEKLPPFTYDAEDKPPAKCPVDGEWPVDAEEREMHRQQAHQEILRGIFQVQSRYDLSDPEVCKLLADRVAFLLLGCVIGEDRKRFVTKPTMPWISKEEFDKRTEEGQSLYGPLNEQQKENGA